MINVLDQNTINKIAAGEVVERPASVVKELVENAIDAKATAITVEIKDGGLSFIRVTDNGCGISKDEVEVAFLRHATSKIKNVEDLLTVASLGFRGEALASIASVAEVELITKVKENMTGTRYAISGGEKKALEEVGAPDGTTFIVRDLFFNTPARRKFLKSSNTEGAYINDCMERIAMSHPEISFRFISNNANKLHTYGNNNIRDIVYGIYGREIENNLIPVKASNDFMRIEGFIGKPIISRGNRNYITYFINNRYIKSGVVYSAIEQSYSTFLMQHRYPFTALHITIDPKMIDVNVHPQKMELRFSDNEAVRKFIYDACFYALSHINLINEIKPPKPNLATNVSKPAVSKTVTETKHVNTPVVSTPMVNKPVPNETVPIKTAPTKIPEPFETKRYEEVKKTLPIAEEPKSYNVQEKPVVKPVETRTVPTVLEQKVEKPVQQTLFTDSTPEKKEAEIKIVGQVFDTYWIVEYTDKMYIIDQHAAHEKVMYEKFVKRFKEREILSQNILPPMILSLSMGEEEMLLKNMETFTSLGFEIEHFGGKEYKVTAVPEELFGLDSKELLTEVLDNLMNDNSHNSTQSIYEKIATMSCKAAVKGNNRLSVKEAESLIKELLKLENPFNCPHGRPTIISMSKYEMEKKFKRII